MSALMQSHVNEGNATMGVIKFKEFASDDLEVSWEAEDGGPSPIASAVAMTYIAGYLGGAQQVLSMVDDSHQEHDVDQIVKSNADDITTSVGTGLNQAKRNALTKMLDQLED